MSGYLDWLDLNSWTPHGKVFDIGNRTRNSLLLYRIDRDISGCGGDEENDNGNGSLMRCQPISCWLFGQDLETQMRLAGEASALTHAHIRTRLCCVWHALWCEAVLSDRDVRMSARFASDRLRRHVAENERPNLARLLDGSAMDLDRDMVPSSGYVVSTLEESVWSLAQHHDFSSTVLAAVNLGGDADTTGAVTGGMAGLRYGLSSIPTEWINALARRDEVLVLADRFADACIEHWGTHEAV